MAKIASAALCALILLITTIAAAVAGVSAALVGQAPGGSSTPPSPSALADIPGNYLALYQQAAGRCPGLDWSVVAGIGKVETNHGHLDAPGVHNGSNYAGAGGPMQFLEPTFRSVVDEHPPPPGGSIPPSRYNPHDAIYAAVVYLCDNGARDTRDVHAAILTYNHAEWYVRKVLDQANAYKAAQQNPPRRGWTVPARGTCSSGFGSRGGENHQGQDIAASIGTPIVAADEGSVIDAGPTAGYGIWIRIQHANGVITTYGHNNRNLVHSGQNVHAGQSIADVGNRGESSGPHLHFQIDVGSRPVDPVPFYRQQSAPPLCG